MTAPSSRKFRKPFFSEEKSRQAQVEKLAHELWEKDGRSDGKNLEHWFEAERILRSHEPCPCD
ncbi:MAG: DUF2934 domain-containing protein [Candidatus Omnitrophica bacterium]|nr:DUF2934 domain-containing protein [Candidatus Omnitrophota bacterium]